MYVAYFDNCTIAGWKKRNAKIQPTMAVIPIETISTGQCFQAWNEYAETGHKICTRNDPKISCKVCACSICGGKESPEKQLICDQCENYFHMGCIYPALEDIPDGEWFCSDCQILGKI